jgi:light-regulated signal transduction histidine kinase (bacteriophytochrome)
VQLLQRRYEGSLDERADEFIKHAVDGATRMQQLIDDLLRYSRAGRIDMSFESVDCGTLLQSVLKNLAKLVRESNATIDAGELPTVHAVRSQLMLLFQNLVANALKFRRADVPAVVRVVAVANAEGWEFAVSDNGIGIDKQYFERIFVIFQRLHTRSEYAGTGSGLALCKKIVEFHGGRIWIESREGQGTSVRFTLPALVPNPVDGNDAE